MMDYVYNDEDNYPMSESETDRIMKYTTYISRAEMETAEAGSADEYLKPAPGCWNCMNFNWDYEACTLNWNNMDKSYYNPDADDRNLTDHCEYHETDPDADWEEIFGGNEP